MNKNYIRNYIIFGMLILLLVLNIDIKADIKSDLKCLSGQDNINNFFISEDNDIQSPPMILVNYTIGGLYDDSASSAFDTSDGHFIIIGGTQSFGSGGEDVWLIKTNVTLDGSVNENGSWNKTFGASHNDRGYGIFKTDDDMDGDNDDGYIIAAQRGYNGYAGFWVIKTNDEGDIDWDHIYVDSNYHYNGGRSVIQTDDYGFAATGYIRWYEGGEWKGHDVWLFKFDRFGTKQWDRKFGGLSRDVGYSIIQTVPDGGYAISSLTNSYGSGGWDMWFIKTSGLGYENWNMTYGGTNNENALCIKQTKEGGYILCGYTESYGNGFEDLWCVKTDLGGLIEWNKTYGDSSYDRANSIINTYDSGYMLVGCTNSTYGGDYDGWIIKINNTGEIVWDLKLGGLSDDKFNSIEKTNNGDFIISGWTESYGSGGRDVWLLMLEGEKPPLANFSYNPVLPDSGEIIQFNDISFDPNSYGDIVSWYWDFDDGNTSDLENPSHQYSHSGLYSVILNVTDNDGMTDEVAKLIVVGIDPIQINSLKEGWNLISTKYNQTLDATDFFIKYNGYYYNWTMATSDINPTDSLLFYPFFFEWNRTIQIYELTYNLEPGYGCWIYANVDCELWIQNFSVHVDDYITSLEIGWNIVSIPYTGNVDKTDILVNDTSWSSAVTSGLISDFIFGWDRNYQYYNFADTLMPSYAYWIYAYQSCILKRSI